MIFRIEDVSGVDPKLRTYNVESFEFPMIDKSQIDKYIAVKIREEVNGASGRSLLSYSKSLATCLLKYNRFTDNELHICRIGGLQDYMDYILYVSAKNKRESMRYSIQDRINSGPLFHNNGKIHLLSFVIDISDNALLDAYLRDYTGGGRKVYASPEKDNEVIVMNPPNDIVINQYMDSVYILYALQMRFGFLNSINIRNALIDEIRNMERFRFEYCPNERLAFIDLICYLYTNWEYEFEISRKIIDHSKKEDHISFHYNPILQFYNILEDLFQESYNLGSYNENVLSDLFWKYCKRYLEYYIC